MKKVLASLGLILLSYSGYHLFIDYIAPGFQTMREQIGSMSGQTFLELVAVPIVTYALISAWFVLLMIVIKGSVNHVSDYGLLSSLGTGFLFGLYIGIIIGLMAAFALGYGGFIMSISLLLLIGLIFLPRGLLGGIIDEFEN